jgi:RND superfamily putative drug exporter
MRELLVECTVATRFGAAARYRCTRGTGWVGQVGAELVRLAGLALAALTDVGNDLGVLQALGRGIARHPGLIVLAWFAITFASFAAATGAFGEGLFARLHSGQLTVPGESDEGLAILMQASTTGQSLTLLVQGVDPTDPGLVEPVSRAHQDLLEIPGVASVAEPINAPGGTQNPDAAQLLAQNGDGFLVSVTLEPDLSGADEEAALDAVQARLTELGDEIVALYPGATAQVGGGSLLLEAVTGQVEQDLVKGELIALPISLLVMVLVFGGFVAAGMPILGALASIGGALATLLAFSYFLDLDASVVNVVTVMGLGLCIDYGLLIVSRYREELRKRFATLTTRSTRAARTEALVVTMGTAGRTVLFSAITVAISLSGLMLFQADIFRAIGAAGVSVVVVALLVALTLVPAMLALAGPRMLKPGALTKVPVLKKLANKLGDIAPEEGFFSRLARWTQRRPWLVMIGVLAVLGLLAAPALRLEMRSSGEQLLPPAHPDRVFFDTLADQYPAFGLPAVQVVGQTEPENMTELAQEISDMPGVELVSPPRAVGEDYAAISVFMTDPDPGGSDAKNVVTQVRENRPDYPIWVTGQTAHLMDFTDAILEQAPAAIAVVIGATFVLLFLLTGSILVPIKALLINVVSLGASLGVLVLIFQDGRFESFLNFDSVGGIEAIIPILVIALGFGLAMDYEMFLLSRIKEFKDKGMTNNEAVVVGLQRSGRIITSAALVVVLVFGGFALGDLLVIKETGIALAVAVAIDATLVRCLLVPATMTLLGEWNWWAPGPLRRLHDRLGLKH